MTLPLQPRWWWMIERGNKHRTRPINESIKIITPPPRLELRESPGPQRPRYDGGARKCLAKSHCPWAKLIRRDFLRSRDSHDATGVREPREDVSHDDDCGFVRGARDDAANESQARGGDNEPLFAETVAQKAENGAEGEGYEEVCVGDPGSEAVVAESCDLEVDCGVCLEDSDGLKRCTEKVDVRYWPTRHKHWTNSAQRLQEGSAI
jgi:hypothetical protein